jgi:hypothetical protein
MGFTLTGGLTGTITVTRLDVAVATSEIAVTLLTPQRIVSLPDNIQVSVVSPVVNVTVETPSVDVTVSDTIQITVE